MTSQAPLVALVLLTGCGGDPEPGAVAGAGGGTSTSTSMGGGGAGGGAGPCPLGRDEPEHIIDLQASPQTTIALSSRGRVYCWGADDYDGCMGLGGWEGLFTPTLLQKLSCIRAIPGRGDARFALDHAGDLWGWGTEFLKELGDGEDHPNPEEPTRVLLPGAAESAKIFIYTGIAWVGGAAWRWGEVWPEEWPSGPALPVPYDGPTAIVGENLVCELDPEGLLRCMGRNGDGEVGDGTTEPRVALVPAATPERFRKVVPAAHNVFAVTLDGRLFSWGRNPLGMLGNGSDDEGAFPTPAEMPGLSGVENVSLASYGGCATASGAEVRCWGTNDYDTISEHLDFRVPTAVQVTDLSPALQVAFGGAHRCALKTDHTVWCRGARATRGAGPDAPDGGPALRVVFPFEEGQ